MRSFMCIGLPILSFGYSLKLFAYVQYIVHAEYRLLGGEMFYIELRLQAIDITS